MSSFCTQVDGGGSIKLWDSSVCFGISKKYFRRIMFTLNDNQFLDSRFTIFTMNGPVHRKRDFPRNKWNHECIIAFYQKGVLKIVR